jgi:hypothetical protein
LNQFAEAAGDAEFDQNREEDDSSANIALQALLSQNEQLRTVVNHLQYRAHSETLSGRLQLVQTSDEYELKMMKLEDVVRASQADIQTLKNAYQASEAQYAELYKRYQISESTVHLLEQNLTRNMDQIRDLNSSLNQEKQLTAELKRQSESAVVSKSHLVDKEVQTDSALSVIEARAVKATPEKSTLVAPASTASPSSTSATSVFNVEQAMNEQLQFMQQLRMRNETSSSAFQSNLEHVQKASSDSVLNVIEQSEAILNEVDRRRSVALSRSSSVTSLVSVSPSANSMPALPRRESLSPTPFDADSNANRVIQYLSRVVPDTLQTSADALRTQAQSLLTLLQLSPCSRSLQSQRDAIMVEIAMILHSIDRMMATQSAAQAQTIEQQLDKLAVHVVQHINDCNVASQTPIRPAASPLKLDIGSPAVDRVKPLTLLTEQSPPVVLKQRAEPAAFTVSPSPVLEPRPPFQSPKLGSEALRLDPLPTVNESVKAPNPLATVMQKYAGFWKFNL